MRCSRLTPSDTPCGKPAIAAWQDRDGRLTWMCSGCDRAALRACSLDPQWWTVYDRLPIATESVNAGCGDPIGVGAA